VLSYSKNFQDEYLDNHLFKNYKNGFFIDFGAYDGLTFNNTLRFEKFHNWKGINFESDVKMFNALKLNRPNATNYINFNDQNFLHHKKKINLLLFNFDNFGSENFFNVNFKEYFFDVVVLTSTKQNNYIKPSILLTKNNFFKVRENESLFYINLNSQFNIFKKKSMVYKLQKLNIFNN